MHERRYEHFPENERTLDAAEVIGMLSKNGVEI